MHSILMSDSPGIGCFNIGNIYGACVFAHRLGDYIAQRKQAKLLNEIHELDEMTVEQAAQIISFFNMDGTGMLSRDEFDKLYTEWHQYHKNTHSLTKNEINNYFEALDTDHSGSLSIEKMKAAHVKNERSFKNINRLRQRTDRKVCEIETIETEVESASQQKLFEAKYKRRLFIIHEGKDSRTTVQLQTPQSKGQIRSDSAPDSKTPNPIDIANAIRTSYPLINLRGKALVRLKDFLDQYHNVIVRDDREKPPSFDFSWTGFRRIEGIVYSNATEAFIARRKQLYDTARKVLVICGGWQDVRYAREFRAYLTLSGVGCDIVETLDINHALVHGEQLQEVVSDYAVVVSIAGSNGTISNIIGGLFTNKPVIAVPVGSRSEHLMNTAMSMLNNCVGGIAVVCPNNLYSAACLVLSILFQFDGDISSLVSPTPSAAPLPAHSPFESLPVSDPATRYMTKGGCLAQAGLSNPDEEWSRCLTSCEAMHALAVFLQELARLDFRKSWGGLSHSRVAQLHLACVRERLQRLRRVQRTVEVLAEVSASLCHHFGLADLRPDKSLTCPDNLSNSRVCGHENNFPSNLQRLSTDGERKDHFAELDYALLQRGLERWGRRVEVTQAQWLLEALVSLQRDNFTAPRQEAHVVSAHAINTDAKALARSAAGAEENPNLNPSNFEARCSAHSWSQAVDLASLPDSLMWRKNEAADWPRQCLEGRFGWFSDCESLRALMADLQRGAGASAWCTRVGWSEVKGAIHDGYGCKYLLLFLRVDLEEMANDPEQQVEMFVPLWPKVFEKLHLTFHSRVDDGTFAGVHRPHPAWTNDPKEWFRALKYFGEQVLPKLASPEGRLGFLRFSVHTCLPLEEELRTNSVEEGTLQPSLHPVAAVRHLLDRWFGANALFMGDGFTWSRQLKQGYRELLVSSFENFNVARISIFPDDFANQRLASTEI